MAGEMGKENAMRVLLMLALLMIVGCASHRARVDCEGLLKPINAPAPIVSHGRNSANEAPR